MTTTAGRTTRLKHRTSAEIFADRVQYWISTPRATFSIIAVDGVVTQAAPIGKKWIGKPVDDMASHYRAAGGTVEVIAQVAPKGKHKCTVCGVYDYTDPCHICREKLPQLLADMSEQQQRIIDGIAADTLALDEAIRAASDDELVRYQKLLYARTEAQPADAYDERNAPARLEAFNRRYVASQSLQDGLGAIVRAMARLDTRSAREAILGDLQRSIAVVELAIAGQKESADD